MRIYSWLAHAVVTVGFPALLLQTSSIPASAQTDILSYHGNTLASNGVNSTETQITPTVLNGTVNFGQQFSVNITDTPYIPAGMPLPAPDSGESFTAAAGQVYGEPLVKTGVTITTGSAQGVHDVVFVATAMDSLYAIDANNGTVLWKDSFITSAPGNPNPNPINTPLPANVIVTAVPGGGGTEIQSGDVSPWVGIISTPVIDGVNGFIYVAAKTREVHNGDQTNPHYVYTLHKVRLSDGFDTNTVIADTTLQTASTTYVYNSGPYVNGGAQAAGVTTLNSQNVIYFNAVREMIRPALVLYNGQIYLESASHGDNGPYHGWVLIYNASSLANTGAWNATPNGSDGGIWQSGGGVAIDPTTGHIFLETGNGTFDGDNSGGIGNVTGLDGNGFPNQADYGDCFVELEIDPNNTTEGNQGTGPTYNPNGFGLVTVDYFCPHDQANLNSSDLDLGSGGPTLLPDSAGSTGHPHLLVGGGKAGKVYLIDRDNMGKFGVSDNVVQETTSVSSGLYSVPTFFNGQLYATNAANDFTGIPGPTLSWPVTNGAIVTASQQQSSDTFGFPGATEYISANGTSNAILWTIDHGTSQLRAYNATNLSSELWTSNGNATRDALGSSVKFAVPTPANGHVYVGTADHLIVYGPLSAPTAPTALNAVATNSTATYLSWTDNANNETGFSIERSPDGNIYTQINTVGANVLQYADSASLSAQTTYFYRVRAFNSYNSTTTYSAYTNVANTTTLATGAVAPVDHFAFDEDSGTSTADSGVGNNGTLIGGTPSGTNLPTWVPTGRINAALSFSGNGNSSIPATYDQAGESAVQLNSDLSPVLGQTSTIMFWINTTQKGGYTDANHYEDPAITGVDEIGGGNDIDWGYINNNGQIGIYVGDSNAVVSANPITDGNWHHIAITRDSLVGTCNVYVDGALSNTGTLQTGAKTTPFNLIGAMSIYQSANELPTYYVGATYFNGKLDDVQIFNQVVSAQNVANVALAPTAPSNLSVTAPPHTSGTELDLTWTNNATNATGVEVWSSVNGGAYTRIAQLSPSATSYPATSLTPGTPYSFYVIAVNPAWPENPSSASAPAGMTTPTPPLAPSGAFTTSVTANEVDLQWTDNALDATGYYVFRRTGANAFAIISPLLASTATTYQDMTVLPGTTYDYEIEAYNNVGYSSPDSVLGVATTTVTFASFLSSYGVTDTNPADDPYNTGIPNLLAYAFDVDPAAPDRANLPVLGTLNGYLTISFVQSIPPPTDITYTVQVSNDLINWNSGTGFTVPVSTTTNSGGATQTVTVRDNVLLSAAPTKKRFIRVQVTQP